MPNNTSNPFDVLLAGCNERLERCYQYFRSTRRFEYAQDVDDVLADLSTVKTQHEARIQQIRQQYDLAIREKDVEYATLERDFENAEKARDVARRSAEFYKKTAEDQLKTIKTQEERIKKWQEAFANEKKEREKVYQQGFMDGKKAATKPDQPQDVNEVLIESSLKQGYLAFDLFDFKTARQHLRDAKGRINGLNSDRRRKYDTPKLHYELAVCGAYVEDVEKAKDALTVFLSNGSATTDEDLLNVAHVQHLLSQVHIGRGNLRDALSMAEKAYSTRSQKLGSNSSRLYQTIALRARLLEYENRPRDANNLRLYIADSVRDTLRQAYGKLQPLGNGVAPQSSEMVPQPAPATELLPIWNMAKKTAPVPMPPKQPRKQPQQTPPPAQTPKQPPPPPTVPVPVPVLDAYRARLLANLQLTENPGRRLSYHVKQALIAGTKQDLITALAVDPIVGIPALHIAAFVGDVEKAKLLVARGCDVNGQTTCNSQKAGESVHGVTPMHLAIGAQNSAMIRYLASEGAGFDRPAGDVRKHKPSAPPYWLLVQRWLDVPGNREAKRVLNTLKTLKSLGWNTSARLNHTGHTMRDLAVRTLGDQPALSRAVLEFLN